MPPVIALPLPRNLASGPCGDRWGPLSVWGMDAEDCPVVFDPECPPDVVYLLNPAHIRMEPSGELRIEPGYEGFVGKITNVGPVPGRASFALTEIDDRPPACRHGVDLALPCPLCGSREERIEAAEATMRVDRSR